MIIPLTIDQIRAAMDPEDWDDHVVTERDAELLGLTFRCEGAKAKFFAWMAANGWQPRGEAAGNVHWLRDGEHVWLSGLVEYAAAEIVRVLRRDSELLPQHGCIVKFDERPGLEIIAEIAGTVPAEHHTATAERWDGGGLLIVQDIVRSRGARP
jgi:hypothetical protein